MNRKIIFLLSFSLIAVLTNCVGSSPANPEPVSSIFLCESSENCSGDTFCIAGICSSGECELKSECGSVLICVERVCIAPPLNCSGPADCAGESLCDGFSRTCFDPNDTGCQTDNQCQLEPGCSQGCICNDDGDCVVDNNPGPNVGEPSAGPSVGEPSAGPSVGEPSPGPGPGPGVSLELGGYRIENRKNGANQQSIIIPDNVVLSPGDIFIIARNASLNDFEHEWGSIPNNTWYSNGSEDGDGFPVVNGQDTWYIISPSGTEIDVTIQGASNRQFERIRASGGDDDDAWLVSNDFSNASPGVVSRLPSSGIGLVVSEWSDASTYDFEFIEIYYAP